MNKRVVSLLCLMFSLPEVYAEQSITVSEADVELLGLEFAEVQIAEGKLGVSLAAQVVASPDAITEVRSLLGGVIERWAVVAGEAVNRGDLLAEIRSPLLLELQQNYLSAANRLELQKRQLEREQQLFEQGVISEQRLQKAEGELQQQSLQVDAIVAQLRLSGIQGESLEALRMGKGASGILLLRAPENGTLSHRVFRTGQYVQANQVVARLDEPGNVWASITVPAGLSSLVSVGNQFTLQDSPTTLTVQQRDFELDSNSQSLEALARFDSPTDHVPGQVLRVSLLSDEQAAYVPSSAVVREGSSTVIFVRTEVGLEPRALVLQAMGEGYLARAGLAQGERILVRGAALVKGMQLGLGGEP